MPCPYVFIGRETHHIPFKMVHQNDEWMDICSSGGGLTIPQPSIPVPQHPSTTAPTVPQHTTNSSYIILPKLRWPPGVLPSSLSVLLGGCWAVTMLAQTPTSESWVVGVSLHSWWHGRRESPLYCGKADQFVVSTATVLATWVVSRHRATWAPWRGVCGIGVPWYWCGQFASENKPTCPAVILGSP